MDGSFLFVTSLGVCKLQGSSVSLLLKLDGLARSDNKALVISPNEFLIWRSNGLTHQNLATGKEQLYTNKQTAIPGFLELFGNGEIWHCGQQCTGTLKANDLERSNFYFPNIPVNGVFKDREANYWFYTGGRGIFLCSDLQTVAYRNLFPQENALYSVFKDSEGKIWVGAENGRYGFFEHGKFHERQLPVSNAPLGRKRIRGFFELSPQKIIMVYEPGLLCLQNGKPQWQLLKSAKTARLFGDQIALGSSRNFFLINRSDLDEFSSKFDKTKIADHEYLVEKSSKFLKSNP